MANDKQDVNGSNERVRHLVEALAQIVRALPVRVYATISADTGTIVLHAKVDEHAQQLAAMLGLPACRRVTFDGKWWLDSSGTVGASEVSVTGPHHKVEEPAVLDEPRSAAALEQAQAAIAGASS
jgi:hypothetical protein